MSFVELKHWIQAEAERMGSRCSSRQAHSIARSMWLRNVDEDDIEANQTDLNLHSDPTAVQAIRNVLAAMFAAA